MAKDQYTRDLEKVIMEQRDTTFRVLKQWTIEKAEWDAEKKKMKLEIEQLKKEGERLSLRKKKEEEQMHSKNVGDVKDLLEMKQVQQAMEKLQKSEEEKRDRILQAWTVASKEWEEEKKKMKVEIDQLKKDGEKLITMKKKDKEQMKEEKDLLKMTVVQKAVDLIQKTETEKRDRILQAWTEASDEWKEKEKKMKLEFEQLKQKYKEQTGEVKKDLLEMRVVQKAVDLIQKTETEKRDRILQAWTEASDEWKEKMEMVMKERDKEKKEMEKRREERKKKKELEKMRNEREAKAPFALFFNDQNLTGPRAYILFLNPT
ncbi:calponin homology domain-containing protein [Astyanax mexicanus]|uniref:Calponin homology domain-containing protein n=1 Tax=Astyanax mexicanus TaxID=7994 RepID=A0A8T2M5Q2_ASTMX|nr:calponin homology domain-containing protein [Astyanax mexicanus]